MSEFNIQVEGGTSVRLPTAGKYCDRDIIVTATGGGGGDSLTPLLEGGIFNDEFISEVNVDLFRGWQYVREIRLPNLITGTPNGYFCYGCTKLERVYMPKCTSFGAYSFYNNTSLTEIDFPSLTSVQGNCFRQCTSATSVNLPEVTSILANGFQKDALIEKMDFPKLTSIAATAFDQCSALTTLIIRTSNCSLANVSAFNSTPIKSGTGYIYFYRADLDAYKTKTNWSTFSGQMRAIEDYPEITGG